MFSRLVVFYSLLLAIGGCVYNDEPMPQILHDYTENSKIIQPTVSSPPKKTSRTNKNIPRSWLPANHLEDKSRWQGIVIHHSASSYGCAAHEHKYHKSRGWDGLGYHFVINNGVFRNSYGRPDGLVEAGYRWRGQKTGAHCRKNGDHSNYWNKHTIGICLIGNFNKTRPTERQWRSLVKLIHFLQERYNIPTSRIKGHRDVKPTDCPGRYFSFSELRRRLSQYK